MKIKYLQSGGFMGVEKGCELDSSEMNPSEQDAMKELLDQAAVTASSTSRSESARDVFVHEIQIEQNGQTHRIVVDDVSIPERLRPLLSFLKKHAKTIRR